MENVETLKNKEDTADQTTENHNPSAPEKALLTHCCISFSFCVCADICVCVCWGGRVLKFETILFCSLLFFT